jgi:secreted trypsin-like serine protease
MRAFRRLLIIAAVSCATLGATAAPSMAIVGGNDASPGEYPAVAEVILGQAFLCTGTLISPTYVLTAGHCGSITGAGVSTPAAWPAPLIDVRIGGVGQDDGEQVPVQNVTVNPNYLLTSGYDISLIQLQRPAAEAPTQVAGAGERSTWDPGDLETIVGWGTTSEGGDTPDTLQEGQVPITTDAYCAGAYDDFDAKTMVCAGFPQGGVDTCQGDSGGPMFGKTSTGALRVVGATSFGEGCAREGKPGVYARVADTELRTWIASVTPAGVSNGTDSGTTTRAKKKTRSTKRTRKSRHRARSTRG